MLTWLAKRLAAWYIRRMWGPRCKTVSKDCGGCEAWLMYDYLFSGNWYEGEVQDFQPRIYVPADVLIEDFRANDFGVPPDEYTDSQPN